MREAMKSAPKIDQEVTGAPVEAHGFVVTPVAHVRGMAGEGADERSSWRYGWAVIRPVRMRVQDQNGATREVRLVNLEAQIVKVLALAGIAVTLVTLVIPALARNRRRQPAGS